MAKKKEDMQSVAEGSPVLMKIDFDAWWAMNENKIPGQHRKEIVLADFRARGLSPKETIQSYNEGLKRYGVKLK